MGDSNATAKSVVLARHLRYPRLCGPILILDYAINDNIDLHISELCDLQRQCGTHVMPFGGPCLALASA